MRPGVHAAAETSCRSLVRNLQVCTDKNAFTISGGPMFGSVDELPDSICKSMPTAARELYVAAYNRLCEKLGTEGASDSSRINPEAHRGAMLAVRSEFDVDGDGRWHRSAIGRSMERIGPAAADEAKRVARATSGDESEE